MTVFVVLLLHSSVVYGYMAEENLLDALVTNNPDYNQLVRPDVSATKVHFDLELAQLISVSEVQQVVTTKTWLIQKWSDKRLTWTPEEFDGIERVQIPAEQIWLPDLVLFNNADGNFDVSMKPSAVVTYDGLVIWRPPAVYQSLCKMEIAFFPFDTQQCDMQFRSFTYDRDEVDLVLSTNASASLGKNFEKHGEWDILEIPGFKGRDRRGNQVVKYSLHLRRKPLFYIIYLIIPSLLITFLAICVFVLPSDSGEKMTLVISCLLSLTVFILLIFKMIPPTSLNIPLISKYLMFMMVLVTLSTLASVVVLNIHYRTPNTHIMPDKFRVLFLENLPRFLHMERPKEEDDETANKFNLKVNDLSGSSFVRNRKALTTGDVAAAGIPPEVCGAVHRLGYIVDYLKYKDRYEQIQDDWKFAAMVTDRLLFYVFTVSLIIGTTAVLL